MCMPLCKGSEYLYSFRKEHYLRAPKLSGLSAKFTGGRSSQSRAEAGSAWHCCVAPGSASKSNGFKNRTGRQLVQLCTEQHIYLTE